MATYRIIRMFFKGRPRAVRGQSGLTEQEAQAYCASPECSWKTATGAAARRRTRIRGQWFEGYEIEKRRRR